MGRSVGFTLPGLNELVDLCEHPFFPHKTVVLIGHRIAGLLVGAEPERLCGVGCVAVALSHERDVVLLPGESGRRAWPGGLAKGACGPGSPSAV